VTLVVARKVDDALVIVSDTKVTNETVLRPSLLDGTLKTITISKSLCISFAGDVTVAHNALADIIVGSVCGRDNVITHLLQHQHQRAGACDFLIACHEQPVTLDKIIDGRCERDLQVAWIGDHPAFEAYQSYWANDPFAETAAYSTMDEMSIGSRMRAALDAVISDGNHPTVGNFVITARSGTLANSGFRYNPHAFGSGFHPVVNTTEPTSLLRSVGVEGGSFRYTILVPTERGIGAIAVHIFEPKLGILLCPKISWQPIILRDTTTADFINFVAEKFNLTVDGIRYS